MTSTLAILGRFSGDKAKALAYCDDLIATYSQCREEISEAFSVDLTAIPVAPDGTGDDLAYEFEDRRGSVTDADYRWQ